jgi:hydroxyethylthiazole kinase-like uncharacterized protein yjeF
MKIVTGQEMRRIDEATINRFVPGIDLMERAGQRVYEHIAAAFPWEGEAFVVSIFLGRGNNAGDGLVVARLLAERGAKVMLHYLHRPEDFSPDAAKNHARLAALRESKRIVEHFLYLAGWQDAVRGALEESDLIVDALLGTGLTHPVREEYAAVMDLVNAGDLPVVAVDLPSGVNADTGEIMGNAIIADVTVTMGLPKIGCLFYPGKTCAGELIVGDIGIPPEVIDEQGLGCATIDAAQAVEDLPQRPPTAHKFARGSLLLIAGSRRYAGAAHLASLSALRTGCGIVYCAGPESIRSVIQCSAPEVIFVSLPETPTGSIAYRARESIFSGLRFDAVAMGPGLTTEDETVAFVRYVLDNCPAPLLIDADGLNAFEGGFDIVRRESRNKEIIVTPHSGELARIVGSAVPEDPLGRIRGLAALTEHGKVTIVHKGAPTVIVHPDGRADVNVLGHPGQATAGSGDVLTGAIAGFLAQGCGAARASRLGVYLHSRAAELAADRLGEHGMIAGDCMRALPFALKELE